MRSALFFSFLLISVSGCRSEEAPPELPPRAIQWERVSGSTAAEQRVISGIVTAVSDTELAFEVGGTVQTVDVSLGDVVAKGHVLARLDPEPLELAVANAEAALAEATALREEARASSARFEKAGESGAVAQQEVDSALALREARESQVDAANARLRLARRDLRRSELRAPFRGAISVREVEPAMKVAPGQTVFKMDSDEAGLRVEVQMPETLISRIRQGAPVEVGFPSKGADFDAGDRRFAAVVVEVGTRAGASNSFPVRADLVETPRGLRPGMTAEVTFSLARDEGLGDVPGYMVPIAAVHPEAEGFSVFVYEPKSSTLSKRPVRTGGMIYNNIAVLEGLGEGDIIATAGVSFLRDGQNVTLLDDRLLQSGP